MNNTPLGGIARYQLACFSHLQQNKAGNWVRYCDYLQGLEQSEKNFQRALSKVEVVLEQCHYDNRVLRSQLDKIHRLLPAILIISSIGSSLLTFLIAK